MKTENAKIRPATDGDRRRIERIIKTALGYSSMDGEKFINRYKKNLPTGRLSPLCANIGVKSSVFWAREKKYPMSKTTNT